MKIRKGLSFPNIKLLLVLQFVCFLLVSTVVVSLTAQENSPNVSEVDSSKPVAQNAWEEIYFRIATASSQASLIELLKSMELESDQAGLASSYAVILRNQIYTYGTRYTQNQIYTEKIFTFLLDKMAEQASTVAKENPEVANSIAITLIPALEFDIVMGKAIYALGRLGTLDYGSKVVQHLENITNIITVDGSRDPIPLNYAASGCIDALALFKVPEAFPVLYQVMNGSFNQVVRDNASSVMNSLLQNEAEKIEEQFLMFTNEVDKLDNLDTIINSLAKGEFQFSDETSTKLSLTLLTRMNETTWSTPFAESENKQAEILRKTIDYVLANGVLGLQDEVSEQLKQSFIDSDNMNVKLLALQGIGMLKSDAGLKFLRNKVMKMNIFQHTDSINFSDERILRQLMYALHLSEDTSEETISVLRDVSITPYSSTIRKIASDILVRIS